MKKIISLIMCFALIGVLFAFGGCSNGDEPIDIKDLETADLDLSDYKLSFEDHFDGDTFDTDVWHYCRENTVRRGGYWVNDAVTCRDSNLVITTEYREDGAYGEGWYTGAIESNSTNYAGDKVLCEGFAQQYGYFEARCKLPRMYGAWAAFWMMPINNFRGDEVGSGADGSEIDIVESLYMYMTDPYYQNSITHAIHIDGYDETIKSIGSDHYHIEDLYDEFHVYGVEWTPYEYIFYIDGKETWRTNITPDKNEEGKEYNNVSHVPEYFILSCEVSGTEKDGVPHPGVTFNSKGEELMAWNGDQSKNDKDAKYEFLVDYVRAYSKG